MPLAGARFGTRGRRLVMHGAAPDGVCGSARVGCAARGCAKKPGFRYQSARKPRSWRTASRGPFGAVPSDLRVRRDGREWPPSSCAKKPGFPPESA